LFKVRGLLFGAIMMLVLMTQGFGGVSDLDLADGKDSDRDKVIYDKWNEELTIIKPISKPKQNKKNRGVLLYLYDEKLLEDLQKEGLLEGNIKRDAGNTYWKKKYLAFISQKAKQTQEEVDESQFKKPDKFNLVIIVRDIIQTENDHLSYCNVYINKRRMGRTNQGLLSQQKIVKLKVRTGVRHMLYVEKMFLNTRKKKWERVRGLIQPKKKYFKIPKDRIRVIEILYDPSKESPELAHMKYQYLTHFMKKDETIE